MVLRLAAVLLCVYGRNGSRGLVSAIASLLAVPDEVLEVLYSRHGQDEMLLRRRESKLAGFDIETQRLCAETNGKELQEPPSAKSDDVLLVCAKRRGEGRTEEDEATRRERR